MPMHMGNHLGTIKILKFKNIGDKNIKFYYQHLAETQPDRNTNKWDGLWGMRVK